MNGFIYLWRDKARNMYYIGSHLGEPEDGYATSSKWLGFELAYRPSDFRRRILARNVPQNQLRKREYALIKKIKDHEFGVRYYNFRSGREKGMVPWNKGIPMPDDMKQRLSDKAKGRTAWNKGVSNSHAAENGKKSAMKISETVKGRKIQIVDGKRRWVYPEGDVWFWKENGRKCYLPPI